MNKLLFLIFAMLFFGTGTVKSQNLTGPSSTMSGTEITVAATGESSNLYITSATIDPTGTEIVSPSGTSAVWSTATMKTSIYYNHATKEPTKMNVVVTNDYHSPLTVKFKFLVNSMINNQFVSFQPKYFTIIINPTPPTPTTYYNKIQSRVFVKNDCIDGLVGTSVTYTAQANRYSSTISQQDADMKATNEINANGQAYANTQGACVPVCEGNNKKVVNGVCETGVKICTNSEEIPSNDGFKKYRTTFRYIFSDQSLSSYSYTEEGYFKCGRSEDF